MKKTRWISLILCLLISTALLSSCKAKTVTNESNVSESNVDKSNAGESNAGESNAGESNASESNALSAVTYSIEEFPLERNGIDLHLDQLTIENTTPEKYILLIHGVTYSSHVFDTDYKDYSLARRLAREGYGVFRLDIAGYGQSETVEDGFMPNSDYAAKDINAAVEKITDVTGQDKIDVFGWSWGTVTVSRFASSHPEHINKLVLCAPILCGVGESEVTEPFHHNTWEHAADDFQYAKDGSFDYSITDPMLIELWCSECWHYDKDSSPNGGRRDISVDKSNLMIDLTQIQTPTLVICGDKDPYLNYDLVDKCLDSLPKGSAYENISGGAHALFVEEPYHVDFQNKLVHFLNNE